MENTNFPNKLQYNRSLVKFAQMRTGLLIADFESRFTVSFQHAADVKYNVKFKNSKVAHIKEQLRLLKENMQTGKNTGKHVGYDPAAEDVEHLENVLSELVKRYREFYALTAHPNPKIYDLFRQLREAETKTPEQMAEETLTKILTPPQPPEQTAKERLEAAAKKKSMERALNYHKKNNARKGQ